MKGTDRIIVPEKRITDKSTTRKKKLQEKEQCHEMVIHTLPGKDKKL